LEALRYRSEGTDIDFKQAQYRFTSDDEGGKAEMLKDLLAMANSWRDGPAYILLGFQEQRPHPAAVRGISQSIDDAKVQQFIHSKVRPKLTFTYEEHLCDGKTVAVITIPKQKRAFYLAHAYGKLKSNVVYVRRGSTTDEAEPPEIAKMVAADEMVPRGEAVLSMSVLTPGGDPLPDSFSLNYLRFTEDFPDFENALLSGPMGIGLRAVGFRRDNPDYWREYAEYTRLREGLIQMQFVLRNMAEKPLSNPKLEVRVEPMDGQSFQMLAGRELPNEPERFWSPLIPVADQPREFASNAPGFLIDWGSVSPVCSVRFGTLLPGEERRSSDTLAIVPSGPGQLRLHFRVLANELPIPRDSERLIETKGPVLSLDFAELKEFVRGQLRAAKHEA